MEVLESTSWTDWDEVIREENDMVGSASISHEFSSTATASEDMRYIPGDFVDGSQNDRDEDGKIFWVQVLRAHTLLYCQKKQMIHPLL